MPTGAITNSIDIAQLVLYAFWIFFAGLIIYLRREDKREGYPLISDHPGRHRTEHFTNGPKPKIYRLLSGQLVSPIWRPPAPLVTARHANGWPGAPLQPIGDPMLSGIGPAASVERADTPDMSLDNVPKLVPLRAAPGWTISAQDPDPRGWDVVAGDGKLAGTVTDLWVDRAEALFRYLEITVAGDTGTRAALVPMTLVTTHAKRRRVKIKSIFSHQFHDVPVLKHPEQITLREEDLISAYFGGGTLFAEPSRAEPLI